MAAPDSDPLAEALEVLRRSETSFSHADLGAPWELTLPSQGPRFYFVISGQCYLGLAGSETRLLEPGDLALLPHATDHRVGSGPVSLAPMPDLLRDRVSRRYTLLRNGGAGARATVVCGDIRFNHPAADHLISFLPSVLQIETSPHYVTEWSLCTAQLASPTMPSLPPGSEAVVGRLADVMVMQAISSWIAENPSGVSALLAAFRDPAIGRAIALIHRDPARAWTVASLAKAVAMSRSNLSARFSALVGEPIMMYIRRWRMSLASVHLRDSRMGIEEIAPLLGYQSGAAFGRAYKRLRGVSPGADRHPDPAGLPGRAPAATKARDEFPLSRSKRAM